MAVYCTSDLHGCSWAANKILSFLKEEDTLFFLGDAIDRGVNGVSVMTTLLCDDRVKYIMGNHEAILMVYYKLKEEKKWDELDKLEKDWIEDGGAPTLNVMDSLPEDFRNLILSSLKNLPLKDTYKRENGEIIEMSHSGWWGENEDELIGNRSHFLFYEKIPARRYRIHGHTSIQELRNEVWVPTQKGINCFWYNKDRKCSVDSGTFWSDKAVLLNLDTFREITFLNN